jgi:hypothetical protein
VSPEIGAAVLTLLVSLPIGYVVGVRQGRRYILHEQRVGLVTDTRKQLWNLYDDLRSYAQADEEHRSVLLEQMNVKVRAIEDANRASIVVLDFETRLPLAEVIAGYRCWHKELQQGQHDYATSSKAQAWVTLVGEDVRKFDQEARKVLGTQRPRWWRRLS